MSTLRQVRDAARELDRADDMTDSLQAQRQKLQAELADVNAKLDAAKADRDAKKNAFKALVAELT